MVATNRLAGSPQFRSWIHLPAPTAGVSRANATRHSGASEIPRRRRHADDEQHAGSCLNSKASRARVRRCIHDGRLNNTRNQRQRNNQLTTIDTPHDRAPVTHRAANGFLVRSGVFRRIVTI
jgi:hypothetical protein